MKLSTKTIESIGDDIFEHFLSTGKIEYDDIKQLFNNINGNHLDYLCMSLEILTYLAEKHIIHTKKKLDDVTLSLSGPTSDIGFTEHDYSFTATAVDLNVSLNSTNN